MDFSIKNFVLEASKADGARFSMLVGQTKFWIFGRIQLGSMSGSLAVIS